MAAAPEYDLLCVGGGASGLFASLRAATLGKRVLLLEKNDTLGVKLALTGGGRCNITNAESDERRLLAKYGEAEKFLHAPFSQFGVSETFSFFADHGLPLVVEAYNRAFPETQKASDVVALLTRALQASGVTVRTGVTVTRVLTEGTRITAVETTAGVFTARSYLFATGGVSHKETGSTGDGFAWLRALGHTVVAPSPTLVPLRAEEAWVHALAGVSLESVKLTAFLDGEKQFSRTGPLLFTHFGLSGPTILNSAGKVAALLPEGRVTLSLDLFPGLDQGALDRRVTAAFDTSKNKTLRNSLREILPPGMTDTLLALVPEVDPETRVHSVTKEARKRLVALAKALPITILGLMGLDRAIVADGGLPLTELDPRTMRSRLVENLFVTGDLLHIERPSGGYSLQLCWTTGWVAGTHAG